MRESNPGQSPRGSNRRQQLAALLNDWVANDSVRSSSGVNQLIVDIAETLAEASRSLPHGYRYAFTQVLGMELIQSDEGGKPDSDSGVYDVPIGAAPEARFEVPVAQSNVESKPKRRRQLIAFSGTFDLRSDSELLDLGYTTHNRLTERERRYTLLKAFKAAPGDGGRSVGTEYWGQPGTPQRLKAIADHLHHLAKYRVDRRTPDRAKLTGDLNWLKEVLYWEGSEVVWPN